MGTSCLGRSRLSLVVSHLTIPILKRFSYLFRVYLFIDSEISCSAMLAKPYPVSGPTYLVQIPNELHCMSKRAHEVPGTIFVASLMSVFISFHHEEGHTPPQNATP